MDLLADVAIYVFSNNPKNIMMASIMSNKTSTSMITSTCFYNNIPMFSTTSTKIYLLGPVAL